MSFPVKQRVLSLCDPHPEAYTVIFPDPTDVMGVRAGLSREMQMNVSRAPTSKERNDFEEIPIFHRPMGNATWDAERKAWVDFVPDTSPWFSMEPTEPYREVVYRCQPFWYKLTSVGSCGPHAVSVADKALPGFELAPMFQNGTDFVYRSAFQMSLGADGLPHSRGGATPMRGSLAELWASARRYDRRARPEGAKEWFSDLLLQMVELACANPSSVLIGNRLLTPTVAGQIAAEATGACYYNMENGLGCIWHGKEHPWGGAPEALADLMAVRDRADGQVYPRLYALSDPLYFTGRIGKQYASVARLPAVRVGEVTPVSGFALFENRFLYPTCEAQGSAAAKGGVILEGDGASDAPLCVSIGGYFDSALRFVLADADSPAGSELCGRLIVG